MALPSVTVERLDLSNCAREPIHAPGAIQPYGLLFVVDVATLRVTERAISDAALLLAYGEPLGQALDAVLGGALAAYVPAITGIESGTSQYLGGIDLGGPGKHHGLAHRQGEIFIVELEAPLVGEPGSLEELYPALRGFMSAIERAGSSRELCEIGAVYVRRLAGFDRTLIYQFDPEWNGAVIAEDRNDVLPSYLDLRFPEGDIPAQARDLYRRNRVRLIANGDYTATPLLRDAGLADAPASDLSLAVLRSVSPIHLQYMRNMGTGASLSVSLVYEGRLWGLISCHNQAPRRVGYHVRTACEFIGQILALQIAEKERASVVEERVARRSVQMRLLGRMSGDEDFVDALKRDEASLLALTRSTGVAIVHRGEFTFIGDCPPQPAVEGLVAWLSERREGADLFSTDRLPAEQPSAESFADIASGLLAVSISQIHDSYLIWFRPEVVRTVRWGGDPRKDAVSTVLSPRLSFETWKETVSLRSEAWDQVDHDAAAELRTAIVDIVLRRAEERAELTDQLARSNKELEAFSYSISHDLRAPFRHIVGYAELLSSSAGERMTPTEKRFLDTIVDSAKSAGALVDDLLSFSQLGRSTLGIMDISMSALVEDVRHRLEMDYRGRDIQWSVPELPVIRADPAMLRLVWQNLISNSLKFTRDTAEPRITIGFDRGEGEIVFYVRDNGCGFDMRYVDKLFGVFQRLHHVEEYEGTGIGLAHVRRIVSRHGGRTWAEGRLGEGATIYFSIPTVPGDRA